MKVICADGEGKGLDDRQNQIQRQSKDTATFIPMSDAQTL